MNTNVHTLQNPLNERALVTLRNPKSSFAEFRDSLEHIGVYLGSEIAKTYPTHVVGTTTVLGRVANHSLLVESPVLIPVLRAGLPLYQGMQKVFSNSEVGFIGAMRDEKTLEATINYCALPDLRGKEVILIDTMLATGGSILDSLDVLDRYHPKSITLATCIASEQGISRVHSKRPEVPIWSAAIDPELNTKGYIVPGLGDAGDRSYGRKIDL